MGVQIFLCISGYLYGQKKIGDICSFYNRRFKKILIPYYIVFLTAAVLELVFARNSFNVLRFGAGLLCRTTIAGGEHLWFVPVILLCYVLTPVLNVYCDRYIDSSRSLWVGTVLAIVAVSIFGGLFARFYNPAWLSCYVIGYALGVNEDRKRIADKMLLLLFGVIAMIGNGIQIYFDYVRGIHLSGYIATAYQYFQNYNHVCLGVFLFLFLKSVFDRVTFGSRFKRALDISDKYSYETYLVHQFLILGPFSLIALTPILPFNIIVILIGIYTLAWALKKIETAMMCKIK